LAIQKSSRHSKITGDFGEAFVLYWLSRRGYECARVDHTGIDLIARDPTSDTVLGISVKSRSRSDGAEGTALNLRKTDFEKARLACAAFHCTPFFAIVVDEVACIRAFLLSLDDVLRICPGGEKVSAWQMSEARLAQYRSDGAIDYVEFQQGSGRW
jgi:Holliday junction resolvase-like predicted endonuclease